MIKKFIWTFIFAGLIFFDTNAQSFGGNPWNLKWQQFEKENIRVIFPEGFEDRAERVFSILNYLEENHRNTIGLRTDRISLVLNNRTNISNGYVGLAPFRSEFFTTPPQNNFALGSIPWLELLSIHEYRHVLQYSNGRRGLSGLLSILFGQSAFAGAMNLSIPNWYFEGDAVLVETAMTPQGRGRIPNFLRGFKAYEAKGTRFSYAKVRNGSFKDFIPDHYRLGYMLSKYGADQYGELFWGEVLADAASYKGLIYPFSGAIKIRSGMNVEEFYQNGFDYYNEKWRNDRSRDYTESNFISNVDKVFTNYRYPQYDADGNLYFVKSSLKEIRNVYKRKGDINVKLFALGITTDPYIEVRAGKIAWSELRFHPTRGHVDYSVLMTYDLSTKEKKQLTTESRLVSPAIHPKGNVVAAVSIDAMGDSHIDILSARDGLLVESLPNKEGYYITYPKWSSDASYIYFAARDNAGRMAICKQDMSDKSITAITEWRFYPIGVPYVTESHVYFSRSSNDAEHIYRINLQNGAEELIVKSEFGAYQPFVYNDELIYSQYTDNGLILSTSEIRPIDSDKSQEKVSVTDNVYTAYGGSIMNNIKPTEISDKKYGRLSHPINLHSWGLTADDQTASLLIQSNNILNTISVSGGLQYIFDDNRAIWTAGAKFGFFYPNITTNFTLEKRDFFDDEERRFVDFDDRSISVGLEFPLNLSSGPYVRSMLPYYSVKYNSINIRDNRYRDINFNSQELGLIFLNRRLKAHRDLLAVYSQYFNINYRGSIDDLKASQLDIETELTFPGILRNHVLRLELDYKNQPGDADFTFSDRFDYARGYNSLNTESAVRFGINYHLPLLYPDFGLAGIAYLKRIQTNVFYDYSRLSSGSSSLDLSSTGVEFLFDTNFFNAVPVTFGIRYARAIDFPDNIFEFFVPFYRF